MAKWKDEFRPGKLIEIEVSNRNCKNLALPAVNGTNGIMSNPGTERFTIYADDLKLIEALVETNEVMLRQAETIYQMHVEKKLAEVGKVSSDVADQIRKSDSVQKCFREITGRDLLPLTSVKVITRDIIQPEDREAESRRSHDEAIRRAIEKSGGLGIEPGTLAEIIAQAVRAALQAQNANNQNRR